MEITYTMNKMQADQLFAAEAVLVYSRDSVPEYRILELFGEDIAWWLDACCVDEGYMKSGHDYVSALPGGRIIRYFFLSGFYKIVHHSNDAKIFQTHQNSEAGKFIDRVWEERGRRMELREAEEERKRQERKAKRAAAKAKREQKAAAQTSEK